MHGRDPAHRVAGAAAGAHALGPDLCRGRVRLDAEPRDAEARRRRDGRVAWVGDSWGRRARCSAGDHEGEPRARGRLRLGPGVSGRRRPDPARVQVAVPRRHLRFDHSAVQRRPEKRHPLRPRPAVPAVRRPRLRARSDTDHRLGGWQRDRGGAPLPLETHRGGRTESGHRRPRPEPVSEVLRRPSEPAGRGYPPGRRPVVSGSQQQQLRPRVVRRAGQLRREQRRVVGCIRAVRELPLHEPNDQRESRAPHRPRRHGRAVRRARLRALSEPDGAVRDDRTARVQGTRYQGSEGAHDRVALHHAQDR